MAVKCGVGYLWVALPALSTLDLHGVATSTMTTAQPSPIYSYGAVSCTLMVGEIQRFTQDGSAWFRHVQEAVLLTFMGPPRCKMCLTFRP